MGWLHRSDKLAITDSGVVLEVRENELLAYRLPDKEEPVELGSYSRELDAKKAFETLVRGYAKG